MANQPVRNITRRSLLDLGTKTAAAFGLSGLLAPAAFAAGSQRSCVCIYLLGGNDSNNMIVPLDPAAYQGYAQARGALALPASSLLPVQTRSSSASYGFHPALAGLQDLYSRGDLGVVVNVGRMDRPLTKGQFDPSQLPADLFEHTGATQVRYVPGGWMTVGWDSEAASMAALNRVKDKPGNLRQRLGLVAAALSHSNSPATYTVSLQGFDTHANELAHQANLYAELNDGLTSFYQTLQSLGIHRDVTVFTATEFNRTLAPNDRGGTEHGWGGHHLILGGSVYGGDVIGTFPSMQLGGPDDLGSTGVWIPSISDQQFAYTLARWYGISDSAPFPDLGNFPRPDLDFLGA